MLSDIQACEKLKLPDEAMFKWEKGLNRISGVEKNCLIFDDSDEFVFVGKSYLEQGYFCYKVASRKLNNIFVVFSDIDKTIEFLNPVYFNSIEDIRNDKAPGICVNHLYIEKDYYIAKDRIHMVVKN